MLRIRALLLVLCGSLTLAGCSSEPSGEAPGPGEDMLAPPAAGTGVQFKIVSSIDPGMETERCQFFKAPAEGLYINREEVRFTQGSHHVLLYKTSYADIPTKNEAGMDVDTSGVVDCPNGAGADWKIDSVISGSQSFKGDSMLNSLPEGVAVRVDPGAVFLMNVHYLNTSSEPLSADARINLYSIPEASVKEEAGVLFLYNPFIRIPASGQASARMRCPVSKDISVVSVQSHMHRRGVNFVANLTDGAGAPIDEIYTNTEWEAVPVKAFEPTLSVKAGQALDYRCDYKNAEAREVLQGATTKDEMCMLIGAYYPRDENLENCRDDSGNLAATWIGSGTNDGTETLACMGLAKSAGDFYGCIVDSCPGISEPFSAFLRCQFSGGHGACDKECAGPDTSMCEACVDAACATKKSETIAAACK